MPEQPQGVVIRSLNLSGRDVQVFRGDGRVFEATDPAQPAVTYAGELAEVDGRLELVTLVFRAEAGQYLRSADLRALRFHDLVARAKRFVATATRALGSHAASPSAAAELQRLGRAATASTPKRGRAGYPKDHYQRVARAYLALVQGATSRHAMRRLAEAEGRPVETVRTWVARARQMGYLSPTRQGVAGAVPGPNLEDEEEGP